MNSRYMTVLEVLSRREDGNLDSIAEELEKHYCEAIQNETQRLTNTMGLSQSLQDIVEKELLRRFRSSVKNFNLDKLPTDDCDGKDRFLMYVRMGWKHHAKPGVHRLIRRLPRNVYRVDDEGNAVNAAEYEAVADDLSWYDVSISDYFSIPFEEMPFFRERIVRKHDSSEPSMRNYDFAQRRFDLRKLAMPEKIFSKHQAHQICQLSTLERREFWKVWEHRNALV